MILPVCIRAQEVVSVNDYLISNIHGLIIVQTFKVHEFTPLLSDVHCALSFDIEVRLQVNATVKQSSSYKKWEPSKKDLFVSTCNIDRSELLKLNALLESSKTQPIDKKLMNKFASDIKFIFHKSAQCSFKKPVVISKNVKHPKPWFGLQCNKARKRYQTARKNHSHQKNDASRRIILNASKRYKATIKKYHSKHLIGLQNKIRQLRTEQPKQYWKLINSIDKKKDNIPISADEM